MLTDATHYADQLAAHARAAQQAAWHTDRATALTEFAAHVQAGGDPAGGPRQPRTPTYLVPDLDQGATWCLMLWWPDGFTPPVTVAKATLQVSVNHGRWVIDCPCGGAQLACRTDPRFFCVDCLNAYAGGAWVTVTWPADTKTIEELLAGRPVHLQNWAPGETVAGLRNENDILAGR